MDFIFDTLKRLPFSTILAARKYGMDNIHVSENAQAGAKLCMALLRGDNSETRKLINAGTPLDYQDDIDGWTPLIYSIYYQNPLACRWLLENNADVDKADYAGRTPLMIAAIRGNHQLMKELLTLGANIFCKDNRQKTAFDFAVEYNQHECADLVRESYHTPEKGE